MVLCSVIRAGERIPSRAQPWSPGSTRAEGTGLMLHPGRPLFSVGVSRISWKALELHVDGDIRICGVFFS